MVLFGLEEPTATEYLRGTSLPIMLQAGINAMLQACSGAGGKSVDPLQFLAR